MEIRERENSSLKEGMLLPRRSLFQIERKQPFIVVMADTKGIYTCKGL